MKRVSVTLALLLLSLAALACSKDNSNAASGVIGQESPAQEVGRDFIYDNGTSDIFLPLDETVTDHAYNVKELLQLSDETRSVAYIVVKARQVDELGASATLHGDDGEVAAPQAIPLEAEEIAFHPSLIAEGTAAGSVNWTLKVHGAAHIEGIGVKFVAAPIDPAPGDGDDGDDNSGDDNSGGGGGDDGRDRDENRYLAFVRSGFHGISKLELIRYVRSQEVRGRTIKRIIVKGRADPEESATIAFCNLDDCGRAKSLRQELGNFVFSFGSGLNTRDLRNYAFDIRGDAYVETISLEFSSR